MIRNLKSDYSTFGAGYKISIFFKITVAFTLQWNVGMFVVWLAPVKPLVNPVSYFTEATAGKNTFSFRSFEA